MALSIPAASPSSSPSPQSPQSSADGSNGPSTPVSPSHVKTLALPPPAEATANPSQDPLLSSAASGMTSSAPGQSQKRKPSRRANTAERRATHNAVERARRETLNGRFLDLAALLPNLSQIRRPSKSSIVNSSIAHIHASRRHRLLAARELRVLKVETDALRRELNEWRDRSGLPRIEEPVRGEGFQMIMSGEVEILSAGPIEEEAADDEYLDDEGPAAFHQSAPMAPSHPTSDEPEDIRGLPFAHSVHHPHHSTPASHHHIPAQHGGPGHHGLHLQTMLPRSAHGGSGIPSPMIVQSPQAVSFDNPAMASMYEPSHLGHYFTPASESPNQKWNGIGGAPFQPQQQFTPPQSSHGPQSYMGNGYGPRGYPAQAPRGYVQQQQDDDASSVGSAGHSPVSTGGVAKRERSGSMGSVGSNGPEMLSGAGAMVRRQQWDESMYGVVQGMGMGGRGASTAMNVGGGNTYGAMML